MRSATLFAGAALLFLSVLSCGTSSSYTGDTGESIRVTGITQVLYAGTRSETVILTDDVTGEVFALVGDMASEIIPDYGLVTIVTGRLTLEGYSVREDLRMIGVTDYSFIGPEEPEDY